MKDLKQRVIRGGLAKIVSQVTTLLLRTGSLMIMARLLDPKDFGLVGMVTAVIGVFNVFRDFGLSAAAIQRETITVEQSSTLFWINLLVGAVLGLIALTLGPFIAAFYHEQHLIRVTAVLATAFLFNAAAVQHSALLERQMRFVALAAIDTLSLLVSTSVGIGMALRGFGYWSLVATTTVTPLVFAIGVWLTSGWIPGRPRRHMGILSMMRFGGTLTLNGLIMYFAMNLDKVLLGRFWGVDALGLYGRAYQLINIPTDNLNNAAGGVVFAALSRLQNEPRRMRSYFLKGYSLVLSLTVPIAFISGLFGSDIIHVFLGPKWSSAIPVFRLLTPTTLGFAILAPLGWLLSACGLVERGLKLALTIAPLLILGYAIGLHWGPQGVAFAYSSVMVLSVIPLIAWAVRGTPVTFRDLLLAVSRPLLSGIPAAGLAFVLQLFWGSLLPPLPRLAVAVAVVSSTYLWMLLYVMKQKLFYLEIINGFIRTPPADEPLAISA
jgi:O-antigen/teichoic acid export membrane protein